MCVCVLEDEGMWILAKDALTLEGIMLAFLEGSFQSMKQKSFRLLS